METVCGCLEQHAKWINLDIYNKKLMNYDINRLYADGDPDYFDIMDKGSFVGSCDYDSENAVPFIIANGELHVGDYGMGHDEMGCNYETDEFSKSSDFAPGRLWLKINQRKKSADFPYSIISFWWGSEEHIVDSHLVDELLAKFHLDGELVLVASFEEKDYGKVYPYKEWSFKVSKANDSQKEVLAAHLMNAKNKHNATSDFRATRDRNIGKKLTNDKGVEMPVAQYMAMIRSENIKRIIRNVIKEYIHKGNKKMIIETWTNNNTELKNHLKNIAHMDDKTLKTL